MTEPAHLVLAPAPPPAAALPADLGVGAPLTLTVAEHLAQLEERLAAQRAQLFDQADVDRIVSREKGKLERRHSREIDELRAAHDLALRAAAHETAGLVAGRLQYRIDALEAEVADWREQQMERSRRQRR